MADEMTDAPRTMADGYKERMVLLPEHLVPHRVGTPKTMAEICEEIAATSAEQALEIAEAGADGGAQGERLDALIAEATALLSSRDAEIARLREALEGLLKAADAQDNYTREWGEPDLHALLHTRYSVAKHNACAALEPRR